MLIRAGKQWSGNEDMNQNMNILTSKSEYRGQRRIKKKTLHETDATNTKPPLREAKNTIASASLPSQLCAKRPLALGSSCKALGVPWPQKPLQDLTRASGEVAQVTKAKSTNYIELQILFNHSTV